jgi:hypothetical protein
MEFILLAILAYFILKPGGLTGQPYQPAPPTTGVYPIGPQQGYPLGAPQPPATGIGVNISTLGVQAGGGIAAGVGGAAVAGTSLAIGAATAGIGAAVGIFATLWAAHERRAAQARDENSASNIGVAGFDQDIKLVNAQYNARQIDAPTAIRALQQTMMQYWLVVTPHIQPGRNGCQGGNNCQAMQAVARTGQQACAGDIGAACCIGCEPLYYSLYDDGTDTVVASPKGPGAIWVLQHGGGISQVKIVGGSKYGAQTRYGYTLSWRAP